MEIDTTTLSPWAEINTVFSRMRSLGVNVGGVEYAGAATLSLDETTGRATLRFTGKPQVHEVAIPAYADPKRKGRT